MLKKIKFIFFYYKIFFKLREYTLSGLKILKLYEPEKKSFYKNVKKN